MLPERIRLCRQKVNGLATAPNTGESWRMEVYHRQVRDEHFELAAGGAECGALGAQNAAQHPSALDCAGSHDEPETPCGAGLSRRNASERKALQGKGMGATGLEPVTPAV